MSGLKLKDTTTKLLSAEKTVIRGVWVTVEGTCEASKRGTIGKVFSEDLLPAEATYRGVLVWQAAHNHWVRAYAYYNRSSRQIGINYVNENTTDITGTFSLCVMYTI